MPAETAAGGGHHVVIVGGGFGALTAARALAAGPVACATSGRKRSRFQTPDGELERTPARRDLSGGRFLARPAAPG
jgi:thioredoxin reductase